MSSLLARLNAIAGRRSVRVAAIVVMLAGLVTAIVADRDRLADVFSSLSATSLVVAAVAGAAALGFSVMCWTGLVRALGGEIATTDAAEVFYVGQLGKYIPGSVWTVATQMQLGAERGIRRSRTAVATVVQLIINLVTGAAVFVVTLPFQGSDSRRYTVVACIAGALALATLHPRVLSPTVRRALRIMNRPPLENELTLGDVARAAGWTIAVWAAYGVHVLAFAHDVAGADVTADNLAGFSGGFALAWTVGFLVVIAPSGAGVREAALVAAFSNRMTASEALAIALVSRAVLTVLDGLVGLGALGSASLRRRHRRAAALTIDEPVAESAS